MRVELPRKLFKGHLDRQDVCAKWAIVPQLVTGRPFPRDRQGFQLLRKLVAARNKLVHSKPRVFSSNEDAAKFMLGEDWPALAQGAVRALGEMADSLLSIDPAEENTVKHLKEELDLRAGFILHVPQLGSDAFVQYPAHDSGEDMPDNPGDPT